MELTQTDNMIIDKQRMLNLRQFASSVGDIYVFGSFVDDPETAGDLDLAVFEEDASSSSFMQSVIAVALLNLWQVDVSYASPWFLQDPKAEGYIAKFVVNQSGQVIEDSGKDQETPFAGRDFFHNATPLGPWVDKWLTEYKDEE